MEPTSNRSRSASLRRSAGGAQRQGGSAGGGRCSRTQGGERGQGKQGRGKALQRRSAAASLAAQPSLAGPPRTSPVLTLSQSARVPPSLACCLTSAAICRPLPTPAPSPAGGAAAGRGTRSSGAAWWLGGSSARRLHSRGARPADRSSQGVARVAPVCRAGPCNMPRPPTQEEAGALPVLQQGGKLGVGADHRLQLGVGALGAPWGRRRRRG